jgi:uncharacterized protein YjfI (DUF2170 family)
VNYTVPEGMQIVKLLHICILDRISRVNSFNTFTLLKQPFVRLGITAMVSLAILLIVSLRVIRTRTYEAFFYTHFVAVL